ncbi:hypothetical protein C8R48DRAFT_726923, partial [Suillus tomentosus]
LCTSRHLMISFSSLWIVLLRFKSPALVCHSKDLRSMQQALWRGVVWIDGLPERPWVYSYQLSRTMEGLLVEDANGFGFELERTEEDYSRGCVGMAACEI